LFQFLRYPNCNVYPMEHIIVMFILWSTWVSIDYIHIDNDDDRNVEHVVEVDI
jgi:hypothetical protein